MDDRLLILGFLSVAGVVSWIYWGRARVRKPVDVGAVDLLVSLGGKWSTAGNRRGVYVVPPHLAEVLTKDEIRVLAAREDARYRLRFPFQRSFWTGILAAFATAALPTWMAVADRVQGKVAVVVLAALLLVVFTSGSWLEPTDPFALDLAALDRERDFALVARAIVKYKDSHGLLYGISARSPVNRLLALAEYADKAGLPVDWTDVLPRRDSREMRQLRTRLGLA